MGQEIEVRPGIVSKDSEGRSTCTPIYSRIVSLFTEQNELQYAVPGGLIGVGTTVRTCISPQLWRDAAHVWWVYLDGRAVSSCVRYRGSADISLCHDPWVHFILILYCVSPCVSPWLTLMLRDPL